MAYVESLGVLFDAIYISARGALESWSTTLFSGQADSSNATIV
jgi:hypothetical protein